MKTKTENALSGSLWLLILAALSGLFLSGMMIEHHNSAIGQETLADQFCGTGENSPCNVVNKSKASEIFSLPTALYGYVLYGFIFISSLFYALTREKILLQVALYGAFTALVADVVLAGIAWFGLKVFCPLCNMSYLSTILILVSASTVYHRQFAFDLRHLIPDFSWNTKKPLLLTGLLAGIVLVPVSGGFIFASTLSQPGMEKTESGQNLDARFKQAFEEIYARYKASPELSLHTASMESFGASEPVLEIVEFADPLCPHCSKMSLRLHSFTEKHPETVRLVYAHFPLDMDCNKLMSRQLHEGACLISRSMWCAGEQNHFWPYATALYENQEFYALRHSREDLKSLAVSKSLNPGSFARCLDSSSAKRAVEENLAQAANVPVHGTPTLVVNGRLFPGVHYEIIEYMLEELLQEESRER